MNLVTLECPFCRGMIQVDPSAAGQHVACPLCQGTMEVPAAEALAAPEPSPPPAPPQPPAPPMPRGIPPVPVELMSLVCPSCGGMFQVPPSAGGMQLPCPTCRQLVTIPSAAGASPSETSEPIESLLPPGAEDAGVVPGVQVPLPAAAQPELVTPPGVPEEQALAVMDRPKIVGEGDDRVAVRRLTPEEKARRRAVRNVILFVIGLAILLAFIVYKSRW